MGAVVAGTGDGAGLSGTGREGRQQLEVQARWGLALRRQETYILILVRHPLGHVTRFLGQDPFISFLSGFPFQKWVGTPLLQSG